MSLNLCFSNFHMAHVKQKISSPEVAPIKMKPFPLLCATWISFMSQLLQQVTRKQGCRPLWGKMPVPGKYDSRGTNHHTLVHVCIMSTRFIIQGHICCAVNKRDLAQLWLSRCILLVSSYLSIVTFTYIFLLNSISPYDTKELLQFIMNILTSMQVATWADCHLPVQMEALMSHIFVVLEVPQTSGV